MDQFEQEKKLDIFLKYYVDMVSNHEGDLPETLDQISQRLLVADSHSSAFRIYRKRLFEDKLIEEDIDEQGRIRLMANSKGLTYSYVQKKINQIAENTRLEKLEKSQRAHSIALTCLTAILAAGALIASLWYGMELYKFWYSLKYGIV